VRKVFELIQTMPQGEERTNIVREYSMHVLVQVISVVCLASFGYSVFMYRMQYNRGELRSHPDPITLPRISLLQLLLPIAGWPTSSDQSSTEEALRPKLHETDVSDPWALVFNWLQYVTCARALFFSFAMSNLGNNLTHWLPCLPTYCADQALVLFGHAKRLRQFIVRDQSEESRVLEYFIWLGLPLASMSIRNILTRFAEILLVYDILPTVGHIIQYAACIICSSYSIVFITVLCDVVFLARRTADFSVAAAEDISWFRVSGLRKQLQMGRVRISDQGCQQ